MLSKYGDKKRDLIQTILKKEITFLVKEFQLTVSQTSALEEDVMSVIMGIKRSASFAQELGKRIKVSDEEKILIIQAIDERIFKKIKEAMLTRD